MTNYRTPKNQRIIYEYKSVTGSKFTICPGTDDVTEADIAALHRYDDDERNNDQTQTRGGRKYAPNGRVSLDEIDADGIWIEGDEEDPLDTVIREETCRRVREAISKLKPKQADAIIAVWLEGTPAKEYAKLRGISENTASDRIKRGFEALRKALSE